jgi:hypothetical protein
MYLQKNAKAVEQKVNKLTAFHVKPPVMPKSNLRVEGDPNARLTAAGVDYNQKILDKAYTDRLAQFNTVSAQQRQYLERLDRQNVSN